MTIVNPTVRNLQAALRSAFEAASRQQATLLLWFIGHGLSANGDYYFLARDSLESDAAGNAILDSQFAVHLAQTLKERISGSPGLDGLLVVVDSCEAAAAADAGARNWPALVRQVSGRVDLLVASDDGKAYSGCFTETLLETFRTGIPAGGENLLAADLLAPVARACKNQQPQHFSYAAGSPTPVADHGLWLVPNVTRARDAVRDRPDASTVDELVRGLHVTKALRSQVNAVAEHGYERLRVLLGPGGSGKSTAVALLVRPDLLGLETAISAAHIGAAVFLTGTSTLRSVTEELAVQLERRVALLSAAGEIEPVATVISGEYRKVTARLARALVTLGETGRTTTLLIDGLDLPTEHGHRDELWAAIETLTSHADFAHVRVIGTARSDADAPPLPSDLRMWRFELPMPGVGVVGDYLLRHAHDEHGEPWPRSSVTRALTAVDPGVPADGAWPDRPWRAVGGWLHARLIVQVDRFLGDADFAAGLPIDCLVRHRLGHLQWSLSGPRAEAVGLLITVVVAAEAGPVLPIDIVRRALHDLGARTIDEAQVRDSAVGLGALIARRRPGSTGEHLGVAHTALKDPLRKANPRKDISSVRAHRAIIAALGQSGTAEAAAYREVAAIRHYLGAGDPVGAFGALYALPSASLTDRIELWEAWLPNFTARLGPDHPETRRVRDTIAKWRTPPDPPARRGRRSIPRTLIGAVIIAIVLGLWGTCSRMTPPPAEIAATGSVFTTPPTDSAVDETEQLPPDPNPKPEPTRTGQPRSNVPTAAPPTTASTVESTTSLAKVIPIPIIPSSTTQKPACTPYSTAVYYGDVQYGKAVKKYIPFAYMECDNLAVVQLDDGMNGKAFSILDGECPPPQGKTECYLRVIFHPPDAGQFDATLKINQKNGTPRLKITLHGTGT
ncbi:caspase family protein [Nocardia sp. NPDC006044]|uniref:caspase family protein n=1 Tax=Nocardia sp. NPDC006044 TaxID=3364306 RepID=UPI00367FEE14